jgi:hypothetical protein
MSGRRARHKEHAAEQRRDLEQERRGRVVPDAEGENTAA